MKLTTVSNFLNGSWAWTNSKKAFLFLPFLVFSTISNVISWRLLIVKGALSLFLCTLRLQRLISMSVPSQKSVCVRNWNSFLSVLILTAELDLFLALKETENLSLLTTNETSVLFLRLFFLFSSVLSFFSCFVVAFYWLSLFFSFSSFLDFCFVSRFFILIFFLFFFFFLFFSFCFFCFAFSNFFFSFSLGRMGTWRRRHW